ncbi:asparagine synthase-related protein [Parasphingorhabdus sp. DH2-15]|uniref:asparagine synthase-related protein n=1 Tax=Parasphingorhabdus sp. DH2-15 TaxID=3444112 RepID=UPI003F68748D
MRFVAFLADANEHTFRDKAVMQQWTNTLGKGSREWCKTYSTSKFHLWSICEECGDKNVQSGRSHAGLIDCEMIGFAFRKSDDEIDHPLCLAESEIAEIVASQGVWLFDNAWGQYLAFLNDEKSNKFLIIRDPTGSISCYYARIASMTIFFSDLPDVAMLLPKLEVNDYFLRSTVADPRLEKNITGIQGIDEVLPAEVWDEKTRIRGRAIGWSPYNYLDNTSALTFEQSAHFLRKTVGKAVHTLASRYNHILLPIGGLDSSMVLSCLKDAPNRPDIKLLTYTTDKRGGDETFYTKAVAESFGLDLDIRFLDSRKVDFDRVMSCNYQAKPERVFDFGDIAASPDRSHRYKAVDAVFTGVGGDRLLGQSSGMFPVMDFVRSNGLSSGFWETLLSTARGTQRPTLSVLKAAIAELRDKMCVDEFIQLASRGGAPQGLLSKSAMDEMLDLALVHPGLRSKKVLPKGKVVQSMLNCYLPMPARHPLNFFGDLPHHHIFNCQPIVEACLQIPTWLFTHRGIGRGLARYAFRNDLPEIMLRRFTKGTPEQIYLEFLRREIDQIREAIISGKCWSLELFSDEWMDKFKNNTEIFSIHNTQIFQILNLEAWVGEMHNIQGEMHY